MSAEKSVVSLKLQSGERFDGISVDHPEWTLAKFLDRALKQLEDDSEIQLPDTEEDLINPRDFKVFDEQRKRQLDLAVPLVKQDYFEECELSGRTPVLYLVSSIFRNAQEVEKEEHVKSVLRKQSYSEGKHGRTSLSRRPPHPPTRTSSLTSRGTSRETLVYLAGRKEATPTTGRMKRTDSPSSLSYMSDSTTTTSYHLDEHAMERIINPSISSDDTSSMYSFTSTSTGADQVQGIPIIDGHPSRILRTRPGSSPIPRSPRSTEQYLNPRRGSVGDGRVSPHSENLVPDFFPGGLSPQSPERPSTLGEGSGSMRPMMRSSVRSPSIPVVQGFTIIEETVEDLPKSSEAANGRMTADAGNQAPATNGHLDVSETPTHAATVSATRGKLSSREVSPSLLERPVSPNEGPVSPGGSPQRPRKTRLATKRGKARRLRSSPPTVELTGSAGGTGARPTSPTSPPPTDPTSPSRSMTRNRRTIYDRRSRISRTSMFLPQSTKVFGNIRTFTVDFEIPAADIVAEMDVRGDYTVGQIKENLWSLLREQGLVVDEFIQLWDPEKFTFTYQMKEQTYELYDEQQIFQTATVVQLWRSEKRDKGHLLVEMKKLESREEKTMNMQISAMIGIGLYQLQFANNDELDITRRKMVTVRRNAVKSRDPFQYCMESELFFQQLPPHVMEQITDGKFLIRVYYKEGRYQTLQVDASMTADDVLPLVFPDDRTKRQRLGLPEQCNIDDYVLKVAGQESYVHGYSQLLQFAYIVRTLGKRQDVELALVKRVDPAGDQPREIPDWNSIDESTGLTGTHHDLSALCKEHTQVFTISMWDIQRKLRIRVVGLDNLRTPDVEVVYIEAGIYHGGELLVQERFTQEVAASTYPRWNQWLVFDTAVKNLPKAARLCIQVVGGNRSKDTKKKGTKGRSKSLNREDRRGDALSSDKALHWVNLQILDHRALLRQGLLRLNLWPVLPDSNVHTTRMTPMGSTAINPDGNNSTVVYIELDTYAHPVACPTGGWGEDRTLSPEQLLKERSRFQRDLEKSISSDPLAPLDKAQKELIWKFRAHCATIPEALPKFLRCVDWADLDKVCEAHRLLKIWRPITLEVSLELLDYHFADDKVRSLAVRQLETLTNDELLCYLLQLTQVLKFEPYHDSALARFLLKRALQSRRIGHFFYWYLRSEMDTPEFNQRFGILLEAYLRGCGEAMFHEIQNQHKAVCDVMAVAASLKKHMERHKGVVEFAREELAKYQLPDSFSPPYTPSLKMGKLSIEKCRVMDSKKSPLWLEFQNVDPTSTTNRPIKVIAKHGDDLRQDMLTLQMLSLMDKLWQANGLDLYIIPYGCIATGNMMGMIEVVQEAETVAKIQQKSGSFSAFKEEPLYDWLKKQNPSHFDAVVEKFMLSCAGYCVATYVLGIGDRHNDNIMLTTSGNLFHIDFGHFLGNIKEFMGVKRERAPFVLTPDFEYVMGKRGSDMYKRFEETAIKAYMIIRENANLFINLFSMMKCTGIPELRSVEDIDYLRSVLVLGRSEAAAKEHFRSQIQKCQKAAWSTQLNWLTHGLIHSRS